jgi:S1-C subfamily serine protease
MHPLPTLVAALTGIAWLAAFTAFPAGAADVPAQAIERRADDTVSAVVKVRMKALADARTAAYLGREREGSGILIDERGHILTIGYVVIEADSIQVTDVHGKTVPATLVGYDHASGFGVLRAAAALDAKPMAIGDAGALEAREPVLVVPYGGREVARLAFVVSRRQFTGSWEYLLDSAIFTTPPVEEWAGSALIDKNGKLVGIGSLLVRDSAETDDPVPGNMFVPIDLLKPILRDLIESGRAASPPRPWLGLSTEEVQGRLFVSRVSPEGPADKAGIRRGDLVVAVGRDAVSTQADLYRKVWSIGAAGIDVPLRVLQGADLKDLQLHSIDRVEYFRSKPAY